MWTDAEKKNEKKGDCYLSKGTEAGKPTRRGRRTAGPAHPLVVRPKGELTRELTGGPVSGTQTGNQMHLKSLAQFSKHKREKRWSVCGLLKVVCYKTDVVSVFKINCKWKYLETQTSAICAWAVPVRQEPHERPNNIDGGSKGKRSHGCPKSELVPLVQQEGQPLTRALGGWFWPHCSGSHEISAWCCPQRGALWASVAGTVLADYPYSSSIFSKVPQMTWLLSLSRQLGILKQKVRDRGLGLGRFLSSKGRGQNADGWRSSGRGRQ